jgi:hypothetical protein
MIVSKITQSADGFWSKGNLKRLFWFFLPFFFLLYLFVCFQKDKQVFALIPSIIIIFLLAASFFGVIKTVAAVALSTFFVYSLEIIPGFLTFLPTELLIIICFVFFPVFIHRDSKEFVSALPFKKSIFLILFSIVTTSFYIFTKSTSYFQQAFYGNSKIVIFILGYILMFYLLYYKHISVKMILNCFIGAGVLFIATIVFFYWKTGNLNGIIAERIGTSVEIRPNGIAMILDVIFPITFFSALYYKKNRVIKGILFLLSFLFLGVLFLTYSRGSYFGLIALVTFLVFYKPKFYKIAIFLAVILFSFTFFYEGILYRFNKQDRTVLESNYDRMALMQSAIKMIKGNYVVFGNGMLTFSKSKYDYSFPAWADKAKILSTHSLYLEHFVGLGLFGFLGIVFMLFGTFFALVRLKVPEKDKGVKFGLVFSLMSCLLHGFVDCQVGNIAFSLPLFSILTSSMVLIYSNRKASLRNIDAISGNVILPAPPGLLK